jgi:tetratricopeptide (TPR) repeat protein
MMMPLRRAAVRMIISAVFLTATGSLPAKAQQSDDLKSLNQQMIQLAQAGKYAEATDVAQRALALAERQLGPDHPAVGIRLNMLALLYRTQGRYAEAEPLYQRAIAIAEKSLGPDHPTVGTALTTLAELYRGQSRFAEAEPLDIRAIAIAERARGPDHPDVATALDDLAELYRYQGRYSEAEPLAQRAIAIDEKALGPNHVQLGRDLNTLAELYRDQGRYPEAEPRFKRAIAIAEKAFGFDHPTVSIRLNRLAVLYRDQGRYSEAEPLMNRALAIDEKALGPDQLAVGADLNDLAGLYYAEARYPEAEPLYKRAIAIAEKVLGLDHPDVANALNNLALLYTIQGRYPEAEPLYKRAIAIAEKALGPDHPEVSDHLGNLAASYYAQGRYSDAEPLMQGALAIDEKTLGPNHPNVGNCLNNLAQLYEIQGRPSEAEPLMKRALAIDEKALGPDHPHVGTDLNNLATLFFKQGDWERAADYMRKSSGVVIRRTRRGTIAVGEALTGKRKSEAAQLNSRFWGLVKAVSRLAAQERSNAIREMFQSAQWAQSSEAAASLAQMAARGAKGDPNLAALARERQDLVAEWQRCDQLRSAAVAQAPDMRNREAEAGNVARLAAIDARIKTIDKELAARFPDYTALASPASMSVEDTQRDLAADEALVLFLDTPEAKPTPEETFIWVITKTDQRWVQSELGTPALTREVAALRCGLDAALWDDEPAAARCRDLLKAAPERDAYNNIRAETLLFDTNRAYALYEALFEPIEDVIKDKDLLIVPSGALTQLPFQVLITKKPDPAPSGTEALRRAAWLVRSHAMTVLPSVSSLKALRELAKESHASRTLIGFGNPLLDGPDARYVTLAAAARSKTSCPELPKQRVAALIDKRRGVLPLSLRSGLADAGEIRSQIPLPETADELCAVAQDLGGSEKDVWLGNRATEAEIKRLSEAGELTKYRIIHFATHGALAGQLGDNAEPGLILTPPHTATERDDGYLSASEIAALKLDADWVILSACNTAAGSAEPRHCRVWHVRSSMRVPAHYSCRTGQSCPMRPSN